LKEQAQQQKTTAREQANLRQEEARQQKTTAREQANLRQEEAQKRAAEVRERFAGYLYQRKIGNAPAPEAPAQPVSTVSVAEKVEMPPKPEPQAMMIVEPVMPEAQPTPVVEGQLEALSVEPVMPEAQPTPVVEGQLEALSIEKEAVDATESNLFSYLALHPDGVTLVELEHFFGVSRSTLNQKLKALIENGKVRKSDKNYLAI